MKYYSAVLTFIAVLFCAAYAAVGTTIEAVKEPAFIKMNVPIRKLLAEPAEGAKSNFDVPIEMKIIARTADKKWYKARIAYDFLGHYEFEGWLKVD